MGDEYIKRSDALAASKITYIECLYDDKEVYSEGEADEIPVVFKRDIEKIPSADVRPAVCGRWIWVKDHWECSECRGSRFHDLVLGLDAAFCGRCGAEMKNNEN